MTGPTPRYDYLKNPDDIYRLSFATLLNETDVDRFPGLMRDVAVRVVHASGMPEIADSLMFSENAAEIGRAALMDGADVFVDVEMVASGVIKSRLPNNNHIRCTLNDAGIAEDAGIKKTTRTAAAVDRWLDNLEGAVCVFGNAPTALFRLLEWIADGAVKPALIIGFPVGFVGARESKQALIENKFGVPYMALAGRMGGSAMAAAAFNALGNRIGETGI